MNCRLISICTATAIEASSTRFGMNEGCCKLYITTSGCHTEPQAQGHLHSHGQRGFMSLLWHESGLLQAAHHHCQMSHCGLKGICIATAREASLSR